MNNFTALKKELIALNLKMEQTVKNNKGYMDLVNPKQIESAENFFHYLSLRSEDIRPLQEKLHTLGLSSLTSSESHIKRQLQETILRIGGNIEEQALDLCDYTMGQKLISEHSIKLFGKKKNADIPYLMVTFDTEFAENYYMVEELLGAGMNVARINCAHDNEETWSKMIFNLQKAKAEIGLPCKIYMDLPGPKLRTSILAKGKKNKRVSVTEGEKIYFAEKNAHYNKNAKVIGCQEHGIVSQLKTGERVLLDDGMIECVTLNNKNGLAELTVTRVSLEKKRIKAEKGINLPDTTLEIASITENDQVILPFICENADIIGYSFVRSAADVKDLQDRITNLKSKAKLIIKIETPESVLNLPSLILTAMQKEVFGIMIARGDLAVEIGFERMSEVQEEILWLCEAAHVPVIWATQVLESLNKSGMATRSEVTDAAHAAMAECVMLNKGVHIIKAMEFLKNILHRSGGHHVKKRYTFRPMNIANHFLNIEVV